METELYNCILDQIKIDKTQYKEVENLPVVFYDNYKKILTVYKEKGMTQETMINILTQLSKYDKTYVDFVYEILDLVYGYCSKEYSIYPTVFIP